MNSCGWAISQQANDPFLPWSLHSIASHGANCDDNLPPGTSVARSVTAGRFQRELDSWIQKWCRCKKLEKSHYRSSSEMWFKKKKVHCTSLSSWYSIWPIARLEQNSCGKLWPFLRICMLWSCLESPYPTSRYYCRPLNTSRHIQVYMSDWFQQISIIWIWPEMNWNEHGQPSL